MRWWWRTVVTLALAPIVWQLASIYLGSTTGRGIDQLATSSLASLPMIYLNYTLPAVALVMVVLLPADRLLSLIGADLMIVVVAPILACGVLVALSRFVTGPRLDALYSLAFAYGLVFGLTVRELPCVAAATRG